MDKNKGFFAEFREFIARGSVMDMAVGVIVGAAFKAIVDSLVGDILMPFIGIFIKDSTFEELTVTLAGAEIRFGSFISAVVNFLILAFVIFLIVRGMNQLRAAMTKPAPVPEPAAQPEETAPTEAELLAEILAELRRDKA